MFFGRKKRERHVTATVLVCVDGPAFQPLLIAASRAAERITASRDLEVASQKLAEVARALLDQESHWAQAALGGEVFDDEGDASAHLADVFADLSGRYLGAADGDGGAASAADGTSQEKRAVIMLTASYQGENDDVERELQDRLDLARVLRGLIAMHERGALTSAYVHTAPAHPDDRLTDEQLLALFPELVPL